jgi:hypothetical protein
MAIESETPAQARTEEIDARPSPEATAKPVEERRKLGPNPRIDGAFEEVVRARDELRQTLDAHKAAATAWDHTRHALEVQIDALRRAAQEDAKRADEQLASERAAWEESRRKLEARLTEMRADALKKTELDAALRAEREEREKASERQLAERSAWASTQRDLEQRIEALQSAAGELQSADREAWEASRDAYELRIRDLEHAERERQRLDHALVEARAEHAKLGAAHRALEIQLAEAVNRAERSHEEMTSLRTRLETAADAVRPAVDVQLRQAHRIGEVGRLVEAMTPDLDKLLESIDAAGNQLQGDSSLADPLREAASMILARASETKGMLRQLSTFSRRQARPVGAIDLNEIIARSESTLARLCGDVSLQLHLPAAPPVVAVDEDLEQLVASLVFNTRELLTVGGSLALATETVHGDPTPTDVEPGAARASTAAVRLTVTATGFGVQAAEVSPSLEALARRCGGEITRRGETGRMAGYSLNLPAAG